MKDQTQALTVSVDFDLNDPEVQARELRVLEAFAADLIRAVLDTAETED